MKQQEVIMKRLTLLAASLFCACFLMFNCVGCPASSSTSGSDQSSDKEAPAEVRGVNGIAGDAQITLNWTDPSDEDFNKVQITRTPGSATVEAGRGAQTVVIGGLTNGTSYTFNLKTVDTSGNRSAGVSSAAYTPAAANPADTTPPAEVTGVNGIAGNSQITLTWTDPSDNDFNKVQITRTPGNATVEVGRGAQTAVINNLTNGTAYTFNLKTIDASGNQSAGVTAGPYIPVAPATPTASAVYMTTAISSEGLMAVYNALGRTPAEGQRVAIKVTTGEPPNSNYLRQELIGAFVQSVNGTYVECMTAYGGQRASIALAKQVAADHGFTPFDLMDEEGAVQIPTPSASTNITYDIVGSHINNYDFMVVLSHFKGHAMGGFGGAIKNMSIGIGTREGKCWIHSHGTSTTNPWFGDDRFRQSMAEAAGAVADKFGDNIIYINVLNRLSVDCDCNGNPAEPDMHDIGILASLDPVAIDKASYDLVKTAPDNNRLGQRMDQLNGILQATHGAAIGIGSLEYELVQLNG